MVILLLQCVVTSKIHPQIKSPTISPCFHPFDLRTSVSSALSALIRTSTKRTHKPSRICTFNPKDLKPFRIRSYRKMGSGREDYGPGLWLTKWTGSIPYTFSECHRTSPLV